jgi:CopG family transcriptional regulator/antitoxin EndoAI
LTFIYKEIYNKTIFYMCIGGGEGVAELKRIMISIPNSLLQEVDGIIAMEKLSRSQFVREAMRLYIEDRKRKAIRDVMRKGYQEMAVINLSLAEEGLFADADMFEVPTLLAERE